jgi:hypothetical protein
LSVTDNLIVDTGSSNTWVGAGTAYVKTSTSYDTGEPVAVSYGSGSFEGMSLKDIISCNIRADLCSSIGTEYTDTVTLGSGLTITQQSIGVASTSTGFTGVDGIVGIGPLILTEGTLTDEQSTTIPTVTQNLYTQGTIAAEVVGVSFEPTTSQEVTNGELTFGGTDATKYTGTLAYVWVALLQFRDESNLTTIISVLSLPPTLQLTTGVSTRASPTAPRRSCPRLLVSLTPARPSSFLPAVRISSAAGCLNLIGVR